MAVFDKVKRILVDNYGLADDQITPDARLKDDLNLDSLDQVEIVMALEEEFEGEISDEEAEKLQTVGQICSFIEGRLK